MRRPRMGRIVVGLAAATVAASGVLAIRAERRVVAGDLRRARDLHGGTFVGSVACGTCHADHAASWGRTFHRTMTQDVSPSRPEVVAGDFSGASVRYAGVVARMHRDGAGQFVMTFAGDTAAGDDDGAAGAHDGAAIGAGSAGVAHPVAPVDAVVVRAVGSRRIQQYLADRGGVLWRLPIAYHVDEKRWFHMNGAFLTPDPIPASPPASAAAAVDPDGDGDAARGRPRFGGGAFDRHVTRWNDNCVFCHNVAPNPGRDAATGAFTTTVAELGIACEACHGPGGEHARANRDPLRKVALRLSRLPDPTIVNPSRLSPSHAADLCGRCHGQRMSDDVGPFLAHGDPFVPGDDLGLYSAPLWRDTALGGDSTVFAARFWDDGTPRLTAYEYQGLLQSRCAQQGALTCTTCHGMHDGDARGQIRPSATGDRACTGCHAGLASPSSVAAHTHHDPGGPGARCVACHMPRMVYGIQDVHRSHRIEIPNPTRAVATGRPDACTLCHVDSDRAWAVRAVARLWPQPAATTGATAAGRAPRAAATTGAQRAAVADDGLAPRDALFAGDPVARAVAADAIGRAAWPSDARVRRHAETLRAAELIAAMQGDRYPAVRQIAGRALARLLDGRDAVAAALARAFEATAAAPARDAVVATLARRLVPVAAAPGVAGAPEAANAPGAAPIDAARIAGLRARALTRDIDIGE